jgi:hypothetical protein
VSGLGIATAAGVGVDSIFGADPDRARLATPTLHSPTSEFARQFTGEVPGIEPSLNVAEASVAQTRCIELAVLAGDEALREAGPQTGDTGLVLATNVEDTTMELVDRVRQRGDSVRGGG